MTQPTPLIAKTSQPPPRVLALAGALVLLTAALYCRASRFAFISFDDPQYVSANPRLSAGLSWQGIRWAATSLYFYNWHPLTWLAYLGTAQAFGITPGPFHTFNFLVHAVNAGLFFYVLWRLTGAQWASFVAGALYAWHPLRVESVAWISETKDVLSGLFVLLTVLAYARFVERRTPGRYLAVTIALIGALASKPSTVTLPAVLLLLDYWPLNRLSSPGGTPRRLLLEKLPWLLLASGAAWLTMLAQRGGGAVASVAVVPLPGRLENAVLAMGMYLLKTAWPTRLAIFYPHPFVVGPTPSLAIVLAVGAVLVTVSAAAVIYRRRAPFIFVGWFWFLLMLSPMLGILQAGEQSMADRYTYLPALGLTIAVVWGVRAMATRTAASRAKFIALNAAAGLAITGFAAATWFQLGYWSDSQTIFAHADRATSRNYLAKSFLALADVDVDHADAALPLAREAVAIAPGHPLPHFALARALQHAGHDEEALAAYQTCAGIDPSIAQVHFDMATILSAMNRPREALQEFTRTIRLEPGNAAAYNGAASMLADLDDLDKAIPLWQRATQLDPALGSAHGWLATALQRRGDHGGAVQHFRAAYSAGERRPQWMADLAWLLATDPACSTDDAQLALTVATEASTAAPDQPLILDTLAAAQARAGRFNDAAVTAERAAGLAAAGGQPDLAKTIQRRMMIYRAGRPYDAVR